MHDPDEAQPPRAHADHTGAVVEGYLSLLVRRASRARRLRSRADTPAEPVLAPPATEAERG